MRKSGLPPVIDENTKILILGTLPSDMSLAARQWVRDTEVEIRQRGEPPNSPRIGH